MAWSLPPSGEAPEDSYQPLAEINVTPMVDVMLVLLVIFMVTAPLLTVGVPLDLPKTTAAELVQPKEPERIVYVRGDRTISYAQLMDALGLVNTAGFTKVSLLAEGAKPK
jgi:biopolymer transport protein TolR